MIRLLPFLALLALFSGCASTSSQVTAGVDLTQVKRVWVERRLADNFAVKERLVRALRARGIEAEAGPLTMMPERGIDAVLVYEDRWAWDFRTYMIELNVQLRKATDNQLLASAFTYRQPLSTRSTDDMVEIVVQRLFPRPALASTGRR